MEELQQLAEQDNIEAQYFLARVYAAGATVEQSYEKAKELYGRAAAQGDTQAQALLALLQEKVKGHSAKKRNKSFL